MSVTQQLIAEFVGTLALVFIRASLYDLTLLRRKEAIAIAGGRVEDVEHVAD